MLRRLLMAGNSGAPPSSTTWDSAVKAVEVTLSNGNMDAQVPGSTAWRTVLATNGKSSGKWQFEVIALTAGVIVGMANRGNVPSLLANYLGSASGAPEKIGYFGSGTIYRNFSTGVGSTTVGTFAVNAVITVAVDIGASSVSFYRNGTLIGTQAIPSGKTWWPAASVELGKQVRLRPTGLAFPVAGYSEWG